MDATSTSRRSTLLLVLVGGLLLVPVLAKQFINTEPEQTTTPILDTSATFVNGPLDPQGYIDYEAALNQHFSEGVTAEINANVAIVQAIGPHPEKADLSDEYWQALGIDPLPETGDYFVGIAEFLTQKYHLKPERMKTFIEQTDVVRQRPWSADEFPLLAEWLQANTKPLAILSEGIQRSRYYNPLDSQDGGSLRGVLLPTVQKCRDIATLFTIRAMFRLHQGDIDGAWADILACHRLGRHVSHGASAIEWLAGVAIVSVATEATFQFAQSDTATEGQLRQAINDLEQLPPIQPFHEILNFGERCMILDTLQGLHRGTLTKKGLGVDTLRDTRDFELLSVMRLINQWIDQSLEIAKSKDGYLDVKALRTKLREVAPNVTKNTMIDRMFLASEDETEEFAAWIYRNTAPTVWKWVTINHRVEQRFHIETIVLSLAIHRKTHGQFPETLQQCRPTINEQLRTDDFTGKPLIYRRTAFGYQLLSVGPDGSEEKNPGDEGFRQTDDIGVTVPIVIKDPTP